MEFLELFMSALDVEALMASAAAALVGAVVALLFKGKDKLSAYVKKTDNTLDDKMLEALEKAIMKAFKK